MYSKETLKKATSQLKARINFYKNFPEKDIRMTVSTGNMKIGRVLNVSLAPIITCHNCSECMHFCYDVKAVMAYPSCMDARARNTALFMKNRDEFFNRIHKRMASRKKNFFLRFHVSGEIVDLDHFSRMVETAKLFPNYTIWTYTKVYWIVNEYVKQHGNSMKAAIPGNFHVMFSKWEGLPMNNPYNFPVFACAFTPDQEIGFKCPGNCDYCKEHNTGCVSGSTSYTLPH